MKTLRILLLASVTMCLVEAQEPTPVSERIAFLRGKNTEPDDWNLLTNSDFKKGTAGWELINWGKDGKMRVDREELHDGKPTLRIDNYESCHSFIRQTLTGKSNTRYQLTGYIKTKDVQPAGSGQNSGAVLMVGRMAVNTPLLTGTRPWTEVSVEFTTKDDPDIRIGPSLGTDTTFATGTAWFCDLRLVELGGKVAGIGPEGRNLLTNSNFEKGTANWELLNWGKDGRMRIDTNELHDGNPTLRVDNSESCHSFIRQIDFGKPNTRYRLFGYIKTKDVEPPKDGSKSGAILMVGRMTIYTPLLAGTTPWTAISVDFTTNEDPEIRLGPSLGTDATFPTGTAWFSDLRLIELGGK